MIEKRAKSLRLPLPDYVRAIMLNSILPEILNPELKKQLVNELSNKSKILFSDQVFHLLT